MNLADLRSSAEAQAAVSNLFQYHEAWIRKAIINVGFSGKFSSDRSIAEYAADSSKVKTLPGEQPPELIRNVP